MSTAVATTGQHTRGGSRVLAHVKKPQTTHTHATHTNNSYDQTQETIHNKKPQTREIAGVPPARACSARSEYFADVVTLVWRCMPYPGPIVNCWPRAGVLELKSSLKLALNLP